MIFRYCFDCELMPADRCVHVEGLTAATPCTPACALFRPKASAPIDPPRQPPMQRATCRACGCDQFVGLSCAQCGEGWKPL